MWVWVWVGVSVVVAVVENEDEESVFESTCLVQQQGRKQKGKALEARLTPTSLLQKDSPKVFRLVEEYRKHDVNRSHASTKFPGNLTHNVPAT